MQASRAILLPTGLAITFGLGRPVLAPDPLQRRVTLRDNRLEPPELLAPANVPLVLTVCNATARPAPFDSEALGLEAVAPQAGEVAMQVPALAPGRYGFICGTASGVLLVEDPA